MIRDSVSSAKRANQVRGVPGSQALGLLLRESSRLMRRRFVRVARAAGLALNRSEATLLLLVSEEPGVNVVGVANIMDIETISAVRLVDALERDGLLERRPHPTDRRARSLWLTDRGRAVVGQVQTINAVVHAEAFAGLSGTEQRRLLSLLLAVRTNLGKGVETVSPAAA